MAKAGANYMNSQLIKMEALLGGYSEGIALDDREQYDGRRVVVVAHHWFVTYCSVVGRQTQRAVLALADEGEDLRNRRVLGRAAAPRSGARKDAGSVKQLLIERRTVASRSRVNLRRFMPMMLRPSNAGILAVDEAERNHVAAHAADAADHHLRPDPRELMHRRQPADEDEIADLAMAAERRRGRKDHVVADLAVVTDMAAVHEISAIADPGNAAAGDGAGVHGHLFPDGAALADLKPGQFAAIAQGLRRRPSETNG